MTGSNELDYTWVLIWFGVGFLTFILSILAISIAWNIKYKRKGLQPTPLWEEYMD